MTSIKQIEVEREGKKVETKILQKMRGKLTMTDKIQRKDKNAVVLMAAKIASDNRVSSSRQDDRVEDSLE